jgi:hypothetical protein
MIRSKIANPITQFVISEEIRSIEQVADEFVSAGLFLMSSSSTFQKLSNGSRDSDNDISTVYGFFGIWLCG